MSERILIIDDETNIRLMMKLALEHAKYTVGTASDGTEGLRVYGDGTGWDLVLLDQRMPGMPGLEVQKAIYQRNDKAKLIVITAFGTIDLAIEAIQAGASDFLRKPFSAETLKLTVRSALDRPLRQVSAVPVGLACREFTRTNINGFSFEFDEEHSPDQGSGLVCTLILSRPGQVDRKVYVTLPAYVMELAKAYTDSETVPGGRRFWHAMCEEALANYLWQTAEAPEGDSLRIEDLSTSLQKWLDSVMTVSVGE